MTLPWPEKIKIDSIEYEYCFYPPKLKNAPIFILLHEGLGCVALWRDFPKTLSQTTGQGVFVYSRRGYGASSYHPLPWSLDYMQEEGEEVLPALLAYLKFDRYITLGHSDGGSIAAIHAGYHHRDENLCGSILLAPHFFTEPCGLQAIANAKFQFENSHLREKLRKYHGNNTDCAFYGWCNSWLDPKFKYWNIEHYLPSIHVPILMIQGVDDIYGTTNQLHALKTKSGGKVDLMMLEKCGHNPALEKMEMVLQKIQKFVEAFL